jgi:hypothetical protein
MEETFSFLGRVELFLRNQINGCLQRLFICNI